MNLRAKSAMSTGLLGLLCLLLPVSLRADTVYTYTGNPMQCTNPCNFTPELSISFDTTLTGSQLDSLNLTTNGNISAYVTSFSFAIRGINFSLTQATPYISYFVDISTDSNGNIQFWHVGADNFRNPDADVHSYIYSSGEPGSGADTASFLAAQVGSNLDHPGTWTVMNTPEPSTSSLILIGAGLLGFAMRKRIANSLPQVN